MTDKKLRSMNRKELLEMLIAQTEENEKLCLRVEELERKLEDKKIMIKNAGSIADASLQLNGVFEAAQNAANQYLENLQKMQEQQGKDAYELIIKAKKKANVIIEEANAYSQKVHDEADYYLKKVEVFLIESERMHQLLKKGKEDG